jgi:acetyl esterase
MPLHPQVAAMLAETPNPYRDPDVPLTVEDERAREARVRNSASVPPPGVEVEAIELTGAEGSLPGRVYRPSRGSPLGTVLWIRGGGFIVGSLDADVLAPPLALASGCAVVSFEYRLAPEHPFPAAPEDCYAALCWAAEHAAELSGLDGPVAVGGESAGGNLAAVVTLMARERGGPAIAQQVLLVPAVARHFDGLSRRDPEQSVDAAPHAIEWMWRQYLADEADAVNPFASPLHAESLVGLPPALVITAEYDVLRDEGEAYARRLEQDGVSVEHCRFDGMSHSFPGWLGEVDAAQECLELMGAAFRRALARTFAGTIRLDEVGSP